MKSTIVLLFILVLTNITSKAQYKSDATYGIKVGAMLSKISNVEHMLISEGYYSGYNFSYDYRPSPSASLFFSYKVPHTIIGLEARLSYDAINARATYSDIHSFHYSTDIKLHTLGALTHIKLYTFKGLHIAAGIGYGWNLSGNCFKYSSNSKEIDWGSCIVPSDSDMEEEFVKAFSANGVVYMPLTIGYEFPKGMSLEVFYRKGLNDVIATHSNRHDFGEVDNRINSLGLMVGWGLPMAKPEKHRRG
ncbi:MAG: outer membrane beta-barrel protein [Bacteroidales bacterium]|nr:outer membrane beta-barrel protein [Bacteroidales bacterium]